MKSLDRIVKLADKFERKIAQQITQTGTTELFFDSEENLLKFGALVNSQNSPTGKVLNQFWAKNEKTCGFTLSATATPSVGASWDLVVTPVTLAPAIKQALDGMFKSVMKVGMADKLKKADAGAKGGAGSGSLKIGEMELSE